jgi:C4-dicarboxylate transporter DctQ subunit
MKTLRLIHRSLGNLLNLSGILAGTAICAIGFSVTWGAISRLLYMPAHWVEPFSVYLFIAASFLGAAYAMKKGEHIKVDILTRRLPEKVRAGVEMFTSLLAFIFFAYLTWHSTMMAHRSFLRETTDLSLLEIPIWIPQSFVPLGSILMCLSLIWYFIGIKISPSSESDEFDQTGTQ